MNKRAAALTVILHGAILFAAMPSCRQQPPPPPPKADVPTAVPITFVGIGEDGTLACESSYVGFGVLTGGDGQVLNVAPGSPAARAFIHDGDVIENVGEFWPNTLPAGTEITLRVRRAGVVTIKKLVLGQICYD